MWGPEEWEFFLSDLEENLLEPGGTIALEFNEKPEIGFYTKEMRQYFESRSARIFRGRVYLACEEPLIAPQHRPVAERAF